MAEIKDYLLKLDIGSKEFKHEPVFTVEEADKIKDIPGMHCKNLFLKNRKGKKFYLVVLPTYKKFSMKDFETIVGEKIKFANDEELLNLLGVKSGAVSPFNLINDSNKKVKVMIDKDVWKAEEKGFHPNVNTATLVIGKEEFERYIESLGNAFEIL